MPSTSEGFEDTGLPPNPAVKRDELDPAKFDPQTAEIFRLRLNKAMGVPEANTLTDTLLLVVTLKGERDQLITALKQPWEYFHTRFQGLKCGIDGTWEQACNEVIAEIKTLRTQVETLTRDNELLRKTPPAAETLQKTDRLELVESLPKLIARVIRLEAIVFSEGAPSIVDQIAGSSADVTK